MVAVLDAQGPLLFTFAPITAEMALFVFIMKDYGEIRILLRIPYFDARKLQSKGSAMVIRTGNHACFAPNTVPCFV
jgi:hypothetical protein